MNEECSISFRIVQTFVSIAKSAMRLRFFFSKVSPTSVDAQLHALKPFFKEVDHAKTRSPSNRSEDTVTTALGESADAAHHVFNIWEDEKVTGR